MKKELGKRHRGSSSGDKHRSKKRSRPSESRPKKPKKDSVGRRSSTPKRGEAGVSAAIDEPSPPEGGMVVEKERAVGGSLEGAIEVSPLQLVVVSDDAEEMSPVRPAILSPEANQPHPLEVGNPIMLYADGEEAPALVEGSEEAVAATEIIVEPPVEGPMEAEGPPTEGLSPVASGVAVEETEVWVESAGDGAMLGEEEEEEPPSEGMLGPRFLLPQKSVLRLGCALAPGLDAGLIVRGGTCKIVRTQRVFRGLPSTEDPLTPKSMKIHCK